PTSVADYVKHGGYQGLTRALSMEPAAIVQAITTSGLRGRGGAAFPTGIKWKTVHDQPAGQKYVTCNADEGDSGTFSDRMLMEGDPLALIEGMTIAGVAVGATQGYIYLRAEYPHALRALRTAIAAAHQARYLGSDVAGAGKRFDLEVRVGAGIPASQFDTAVDYEALAGIGAMLGHGGIVVFDDSVDMARMARYAMEFCAIESCGKCTPCRIGSTRGVEVIDRILAGVDGERNVRLLEELCESMVTGSLCGLGGMAPFPVQSA